MTTTMTRAANVGGDDQGQDQAPETKRLGRPPGLARVGLARVCVALWIALSVAACDESDTAGDAESDVAAESADRAEPSSSDAAPDAEVAEQREPRVIQRVVRQRFDRFRACYEALLGADPKAAGTVSVRFVIDPAGGVSDVTTDSTFADADIAACVARHFEALAFPAHDGPTTVTYPIAFSP